MRALTTTLRERADRPIFVASDMERGAGQQVRGLPTFPDAGVWGRAATLEEIRVFGAASATDAMSVGVDVLFAPVLDVRSEPDNPIVGCRAFSWDPDRVAAAGAAFAEGVLEAGAVPVAKHVPGHGATDLDSHDDVPVVRERVERLEARDLRPFRELLERGLAPGVMTAHVAYPTLDPSGVIATFSAPILERVRAWAPDPDDVAFFSDALLMEGASRGIGEVEAARRALVAGCDLLLVPTDPDDLAAGLAERVARDDGLAARAEEAVGRVHGLCGRIALAGAAPRRIERDEADAAALGAARRAVAQAWTGGGERGWVLVIDDDDEGDRGRILTEHARAAGVPAHVVALPRGERPPETCPVAEGWTVVLFSSIRAWKGASGLSETGRRVVEGLRRASEDDGTPLRIVTLGSRAPWGGIHVPGTGAAVERAVAERLFGA